MPHQTDNKNFIGQLRPSSIKTPWLRHPFTQIGLILGLGLALYLNILHAPFIFDDYPCIIENPAIRNLAYFMDFDRVRELAIYGDIKNNFALRLVTYLTFALNYKINGLNVLGYHLVNIVIHLLNAVLIYFLATVTLQRAPLIRPDKTAPRAVDYIPLLVALFFVSHPLQTQAVTYIAQRFTSLATLFYLAALLLYIIARTAKSPTKRWISYGFSLLLTFVAMKTKSITFTLPAMIVLYDLLFLGKNRQRWLWLTPFFLTLSIIPGTLIWLVATDDVVSPEWKINQAINLVNFSKISHWDYLKTQFAVIVSYLRLFVLPVGQNMAHDYPLARNLFEPKIFGSFLLLLSLFGGAIWLALRSYKAKERNADRLVAFGILWFFITISITSSFIPLDHLMVEYRVYLPSFGIFFAVAVAAAAAVDKGWISNRIFFSAALLAVVLLSIATVARNDLYTDKIRLNLDTIAKSPDRLEARLRLAYAYLESNRFDEAIVEYTGILQTLPNDENMIVNLGLALSSKGLTAEAIRQFQKALVINPQSSLAHANLGFEYINGGRIADAETELRLSLTLDPHFGAARNRLALLYEEQGRRDEAIEQYRKLLNSYPDHPAVISQLQKLGAWE